MKPVNRANAFTLMAGAISKTPHLSGGGREVFVALCRHANTELKCWPSQTTLAKELGSTRQRIGRMYRELQTLGHIYTDGTKTPGGVTVWTINAESLGLAKALPSLPAPATEVEAAENTETKAVPAPAQAPRQYPAAQTLTRVLEALGALERRMGALEQALGRIADKLGVSAEAPTPVAPAAPVAPAPKSAKGKAERPEQLLLLPGGGNTTETEQKPAWDIEDGWQRFWDAYPRHTDEKEGHRNFVKEFNRRADPEARLQKLLLLVEQMKGTAQWTKDKGKYVWVAKNFLTKWEKVAAEYAAGKFPPAGSGGSSSRYGQKLPVSDKEIEEYTARMEGRAPEDEDESGSGADGAPEEDLSEEDRELLLRMEGRA